MNIGKKESVQQFEGQALFIIVASVSINGGVFLGIMIIGQTVNCTPS